MNRNLEHIIKVDYQQNRKNPEHIFKAMAELIEAFKRIDLVAVNSISADIRYNCELISITSGSLITRLLEIIILPEQGIVGELGSGEQIDEYIQNGREILIDTINDNNSIDSADTIREVQEKLDNLADQNNLKNTITYQKVQPITIAKNLHKLSKAANHLNEEEYAFYGKDEPDIMISTRTSVNMKSITDQLAKETIEANTEVYLKIKMPDLLGTSMWTFMHGSRKVSAHIMDNEWLREFHNRIPPLGSGDVMKAKVNIVTTYNARGEIESTVWNITEVISVTPGIDIDQIEVFDE